MYIEFSSRRILFNSRICYSCLCCCFDVENAVCFLFLLTPKTLVCILPFLFRLLTKKIDQFEIARLSLAVVPLNTNNEVSKYLAGCLPRGCWSEHVEKRHQWLKIHVHPTSNHIQQTDGSSRPHWNVAHDNSICIHGKIADLIMILLDITVLPIDFWMNACLSNTARRREQPPASGQSSSSDLVTSSDYEEIQHNKAG